MNYIARTRILNGISKTKMAHDIGISRAELGNIENGFIKNIKPEIIEKISNYLNVDYVTLLGKEILRVIPKSKKEIQSLKSILDEIGMEYVD